VTELLTTTETVFTTETVTNYTGTTTTTTMTTDTPRTVAQDGIEPDACQVTDTTADPDVVYDSLAVAVASAGSGHSLTLRGICRGTVYIGAYPRQSIVLTITGIQPPGAVYPTIDAQSRRHTVTIVNQASITFKDLRITGGAASLGGGMMNYATATLDGVDVSGNSAVDGGGIYNSQGTLTLTGSTRIHGHTVSQQGGGIYNELGSVVITGAAEVDHNSAGNGGGGIFNQGGTLTSGVCGTAVHDNSPDDCAS
jgi:hypothetical protein